MSATMHVSDPGIRDPQGPALPAGTIQRVFRDAHAGTQHITCTEETR
jgi:hypothetical protein